ncbi:hypothetical protein [Pseudoflavitalea rhizosphaerae]|uniref:hypothetical protein n=1 Tax=Pseudoflavitalea rhizosphaerae TaxID=1884793 RepID=UPI000F8F14A6|nr:hypothetical protein [Pseudoflavitalea rhizosphaerae]
MRYFLISFLLLVSNIIFGQDYFEGEIGFRFEIEKKDPSFDLKSIVSYPAKQSVFYFKNGNWVDKLDTGMIEYQCFNHVRNLQLYKIRGVDTLLYYSYEKRTPEQDSVLSITSQENTDTILGKACNRLTLRTVKMTLTFIYSPDIKINPDWFSKTKGGYYDLIYSRMKSLYLMYILETDQYISKGIATRINYEKIPDEFFPDIEKLPKQEL